VGGRSVQISGLTCFDRGGNAGSGDGTDFDERGEAAVERGWRETGEPLNVGFGGTFWVANEYGDEVQTVANGSVKGDLFHDAESGGVDHFFVVDEGQTLAKTNDLLGETGADFRDGTVTGSTLEIQVGFGTQDADKLGKGDDAVNGPMGDGRENSDGVAVQKVSRDFP